MNQGGGGVIGQTLGCVCVSAGGGVFALSLRPERCTEVGIGDMK